MIRKKAEQRQVNIRPDDIEVTTPEWLNGKIVLTFVVWNKRQVIKYNVHLDFFWLGLIVDAIRDVLTRADDTIRELKSNLRRTGS